MTIKRRLFLSNVLMIVVPALVTALTGLLRMVMVVSVLRQGSGLGYEEGGELAWIGRTCREVLQEAPADSGSREPQPLPAQPKARSKSAKAAPAVDLTAFIVRDEGRSAKNKTFYLDAAVIDALHRAAVAQKVTDSKLVNDILKKLLGV